LRLGSTTQAQVADLSSACEPATFGLGPKDVLDETYRKAGKLDEGKFSWVFNPDYGDFASRLVTGLFPWSSLDKGIRFEMYKLNVYGCNISTHSRTGEGSFFRPHQDTPRSEDMFGSLVFVLPFDHEGGNLLLRHGGREFSFDGASLLKTSPPGSVAYIAFFSDVEHEVAKVTSGHRVTITYNLYFDSEKCPPLPMPTTSGIRPEHPFKTALKNCLADEKFKKDHPYIGFGLSHAYPSEAAIRGEINPELKGVDATLIQILTELGVDFNFYLLYRESRPDSDSDSGSDHSDSDDHEPCPYRILSRKTVDGYEADNEDGDSWNVITWGNPMGAHNNYSSKPKKPICYIYHSGWWCSWKDEKTRHKNISVDWVTDPKEEYVERSVAMAYGNSPELEFYYHQLCVLVKVMSPKELLYDVGDKKG
ncbi:hypothetical protein P691DRAFT_683343, partial [Macrolepiota fuliginosa MF-IS2]